MIYVRLLIINVSLLIREYAAVTVALSDAWAIEGKERILTVVHAVPELHQ